MEFYYYASLKFAENVANKPVDVDGRTRLVSRFRPSNKVVVSSSKLDINLCRMIENLFLIVLIDNKDDDDSPSSRIFNRLLGKSEGNNLFSGLRNFNPLMAFPSCQSANGEDFGICLPHRICSFQGGRTTSGRACRMGSTCCVSEYILHLKHSHLFRRKSFNHDNR